MRKQDPAIACSVPSTKQESEEPSMASPTGAAPARRSAVGHEIAPPEASAAPEDFEFCVLSSGGLALAGGDGADMCAADEVFSGGKLLPLRLSSATMRDASTLLLLRSDSLDGATTATSTSGFSSRSSSRGASSSSSSSCVSRSTSSKSASSNPPSVGGISIKSASSLEAAVKPPRRSAPSSVFYAHPSPSPRPPRHGSGSAASAARRSTGSAPPAAWGIIRLGVVGAPEVYPRRAPGDSRKMAAARGGSQSAKFEQVSAESTNEAVTVDKKLGLGILGAGLVCSCSPDAVAPVGTAEAAATEARRRRKKAEDKNKAAKQRGQSTSRRSRILDWLEDLSMPRTKNVV